MRLTLGFAVEYRVFDRNPLTADAQPYGAVLNLVTGFRFDLDRDLIVLVQALDGTRLTIAELLAKTGIAPDVVLRLLDQGVNRGMFRILLAEEHLHWVVDEVSQVDPRKVVLQS